MAAAVLAVVGMNACAATPTKSMPGPAVVDVKMSEYRFSYDRRRLAKGRVVFTFENIGRLDHDASLVILPTEVGPIVEQLRSSNRLLVARQSAIPAIKPGRGGTFAVDLKPGPYALICFVADPDGKQHGAKGMASKFTVK